MASLEDIADAMNAVLARFRFPAHPYSAYRYFVGDGLETLVRRALPEGRRDDDTVTSILPAMRAEYAGRATAKARLYDGIPELLDALATRRIPTAICSNKPQGPLDTMVAALLGRWTFTAVVGARPDLPRKPDPAGALGIAAQLGIPPKRWLYLGDTDTDMQTARAAGMKAAGVLWGFRGAEELRAAGAHVLLDQPHELIPQLVAN